MLEDLATDQALIKRQVQKVFPDAVFNICSTKEEFHDKVKWVTPDVILCDYEIPGYNGLEALLYVKERLPHVPFVFITGFLNNEEKAADAILKGAAGYILKQNLDKIPEKLPAIIEQSRLNFEAIEKNKQQLRDKQILLQKALALVEQAEDFSQKEEVHAILQQIHERIKNLKPS